ncbi:MAG: hypothetical protein C5B50_17865 [Verrucomicrobia bacterium]|nr:MAG: hypothetical protein C5B50_17865 [Verrucomicrobiota bacterium]
MEPYWRTALRTLERTVLGERVGAAESVEARREGAKGRGVGGGFEDEGGSDVGGAAMGLLEGGERSGTEDELTFAKGVPVEGTDL